METDDIFRLPLAQLGMSENFYLRCRLMGFQNLSDILATPSGELVHMEGFSFSWLGELTKLLASKGLLHLLQPLPGSN